MLLSQKLVQMTDLFRIKSPFTFERKGFALIQKNITYAGTAAICITKWYNVLCLYIKYWRT